MESAEEHGSGVFKVEKKISNIAHNCKRRQTLRVVILLLKY